MLYFAPELCNKQPYDAKVDVWAVGVVAYYLLTRTYPFDELGLFQSKQQKNRKISKKITTQEPDLSEIADPAARQFISACLSKDPA